MRKIELTVSSCRECPFCHENNGYGGFTMHCGRNPNIIIYDENDGMEIGNPEKIPNNCPFEEVPNPTDDDEDEVSNDD